MIGRLSIRSFVFLERYPKFLHSAIAPVDSKRKKNHSFQKVKGTLWSRKQSGGIFGECGVEPGKSLSYYPDLRRFSTNQGSTSLVHHLKCTQCTLSSLLNDSARRIAVLPVSARL